MENANFELLLDNFKHNSKIEPTEFIMERLKSYSEFPFEDCCAYLDVDEDLHITLMFDKGIEIRLSIEDEEDCPTFVVITYKKHLLVAAEFTEESVKERLYKALNNVK